MIIQSKRVWIANQFMPAQIEVEDGKILGIYAYGKNKVDKDYENNRIVPGFIDVHTHGAYGFDTNDANPEGLRNWLKKIPSEGVTGILPTTVTQLYPVLTKALKNVAKVYEEGYEGAEILGIHFEGPYLDMDYKGAQPPEAIVKPTVEEFKYYQECAKGLIKIVTIAPEHDENYELIKYFNKTGVIASMGHSSATYEQALEAVANGVKSMTHVYNGMTPYHHRNLGIVGSAFRFRDVFGEIICDGCHSTLAALNNYFTAKGRDYGIMISDSLMAKGCSPDGKYSLGGHDIVIGEDGLARIAGTTTIAGSTLRINQGLKNLVEGALVPFDVALNSCTINPARLLRVDDRKGKIMATYDADLVVLNDNYDVLQTYCKGKEML